MEWWYKAIVIELLKKAIRQASFQSNIRPVSIKKLKIPLLPYPSSPIIAHLRDALLSQSRGPPPPSGPGPTTSTSHHCSRWCPSWRLKTACHLIDGPLTSSRPPRSRTWNRLNLPHSSGRGPGRLTRPSPAPTDGPFNSHVSRQRRAMGGWIDALFDMGPTSKFP